MTDKEKPTPDAQASETAAYTTSSGITYFVNPDDINVATYTVAETPSPDQFASLLNASDDYVTTVSQDYQTTSFAGDSTFTTKDGVDPVTFVSYRGYNVPIYLDEAGQQFYCIWDGQELEFGAYNMDYAADLESMIDRKLDVIYTFEVDSGYFGARLEWFDNAGNRDIKLLYRGRILKVFLVNSKNTEVLSDAVLKELLSESVTALRKVVIR